MHWRDGSAPKAIEEAAGALAGGHLVAFPTETVYGLGADGLNTVAVQKIFHVKGRPADHPLILHVADIAHARSLVSQWPQAAQTLADHFWPGPLTLILKRAAHVSDMVTGGQDTVGIRIPAHPVALSLLRDFSRVGSGVIAAPSANRFGAVSPTRARDVVAGLGTYLGQEDIILDGGDCTLGLESTIVDLSRDVAQILRPGGLPRASIEQALAGVCSGLGRASGDQPKVSGSLASHYAPNAKARLLQPDRLADAGSEALAQSPQAKIVALCLQRPIHLDARIEVRLMPVSAQAYAQRLYATLNDLDQEGTDLLLIEMPPDQGPWEAVRDRLQRACALRP